MDMDDIGHRQANMLYHAMRQAGLRLDQVWMHYFSFGGEVGEMEVEAYLNHAMALPKLQRDMLAQAVNELIDSKPIMRAPYTEDLLHPSDGDHDESGRVFSDAGEQDRRDTQPDDEPDEESSERE